MVLSLDQATASYERLCGAMVAAVLLTPCRSAVSSALEKRRPLQRFDALHERI
ncbi:hypothetical protein [Xylella fastidiosa]|uniref:hypothetical protein n=1 Tax=Xylella fastidiosa TaxID=2371 RepID=UPI000B19C851|nr:hypothetical protein [Xylella fastidiosa]